MISNTNNRGGLLLGPRARRAIKIAIGGGSKEQRAEIRKVLEEINALNLEVADLSAVLQVSPIESPAADILLMVLEEAPEMWASELGVWTQGDRRPVIIAMIGNRTGEAVRQAMRAGADEVVFLPADRSELARSLLKVSEARGMAGRLAGNLTCSFVSAAGGVGVSTLTAAAGLALRRITSKQVALIDLGLQCSALSALLDLEPEHTITELCDPTSPIDSIRLESVLSTHDSGLYLLAAPKRLEESELVSVSTISATLKVMRELFDYVLIDCGHHMMEGLVAAWEQSEKVFYVVEQSVTSVRPAQRFIDLFERLQLTSINLQFILNRFDEYHPFNAKKIETALQRPIGLTIPRDDRTFARSQINGADLAAAAPRSLARDSIDSLALQIANLPAEAVATARAGSFIGRLFSAARP